MKKHSLIFFVALVLFMTGQAGAQHGVGVCAGLNLVKVKVVPDKGVNYQHRLGFGVGGVLDIQLTKKTLLHLEPVYLQKGSKVEFDGRETKLNLAYIEVPALVRYALGKSNWYMRYHTNTQVYLVAGPTVGFLVSNVSSSSDEFEIIDTVKSIDFGIEFGAGVSFPAGAKTIYFEGRYALGLANINDNSDNFITDIKTRGIRFVAGLTFLIPSFAD